MNKRLKKFTKQGIALAYITTSIVLGATLTVQAVGAPEETNSTITNEPYSESSTVEASQQASSSTVFNSAISNSDESLSLSQEAQNTNPNSSSLPQSVLEESSSTTGERETEDASQGEPFALMAEESAYVITSGMAVNNQYDLVNLPPGTQTILIDTGTVLTIQDSRTGDMPTPVNILVNPNSGVEVSAGVTVADIATHTQPGDAIHNIIIYGTAHNILIADGTVLNTTATAKINVGAQETGIITGNITLGDNVNVHIDANALVGIGAIYGGTVQGNILLGNDITVSSATQTGIHVAVGAYSNSSTAVSKIGSIEIGANFNANVQTTTDTAVVGVSHSIGKNITVGPETDISFKNLNDNSSQGVAVGATGSMATPGILNDITLMPSDSNSWGSYITFHEGVGVGLFHYGEIGNITIGDKISFYSGLGDSTQQTYIGSHGNSDGGTIRGNITLGNNVSLYRTTDNIAALGVGAYSSTINGNIIIGKSFRNPYTTVGVGVLPMHRSSSAGDISIGKYSYFISQTVDVGVYSGSNNYSGSVGNITIEEQAYMEAGSVAVGSLGKNSTTKSITLGRSTIITSDRLGIGGANGGIVNGSISLKNYTTIKPTENQPYFTAIGVGYDDRLFTDTTGQKVTGNITIDGHLILFYENLSNEYPIVNLLGNPDGKIIVLNGAAFQQQQYSYIADPVTSDRTFVNQYGETLTPYSVPLAKRLHTIQVPAKGTFASYNYTLTSYDSIAEHYEPNNMYVYLPERQIDVIATLPKAEGNNPPNVTTSLGMQINQNIVDNLNTAEGFVPVVKISSLPDHAVIGEFALTPENQDAGIYTLGNGKDNTQDDVIFINLASFKLKQGQKYQVSIPAHTFTSNYLFLTQPQEIQQVFAIQAPRPPVSSSSKPPVSSSSKPPASSSVSSSISIAASSSNSLAGSSSSSAVISSSATPSASSAVTPPPPAPVVSSSRRAPASSVANSTASTSVSGASSQIGQSGSTQQTVGGNTPNNASNQNTAGVAQNTGSKPNGTIGENNTDAASIANQNTLDHIIADGIPTFTIGTSQIPLYGNRGGTWAFASLFLALFSSIIPLVLLIVNYRKTGKNTLKTGYTSQGRIFAIIGLAAGVISPLLFLLTQNLSHLMVVFDKKTILFFILLVAQIVLLGMAKASRLTQQDDTL